MWCVLTRNTEGRDKQELFVQARGRLFRSTRKNVDKTGYHTSPCVNTLTRKGVGEKDRKGSRESSKKVPVADKTSPGLIALLSIILRTPSRLSRAHYSRFIYGET